MNLRLKLKVYQFYKGYLHVSAFEQWLYENIGMLEEILSEELFFELMAFNYKANFAHKEFFKAFDYLMDWGEYEIWNLKQLLASIINKDDDFYKSLKKIYELSNKGYAFLSELALGHYLGLIDEFLYDKLEWEELSSEKQQALIEKYHPKVKVAAQKVYAWIQEGKIIFTHKREKPGDGMLVDYEDHRLFEDLTVWESEGYKLKKN